MSIFDGCQTILQFSIWILCLFIFALMTKSVVESLERRLMNFRANLVSKFELAPFNAGQMDFIWLIWFEIEILLLQQMNFSLQICGTISVILRQMLVEPPQFNYDKNVNDTKINMRSALPWMNAVGWFNSVVIVISVNARNNLIIDKWLLDSLNEEPTATQILTVSFFCGFTSFELEYYNEC